MNVNEMKTLEARQRRMERTKSRREFLCRCVDGKLELDDSAKEYFKNKINNLEIKDKKTLLSEIEEFELEQQFLNFYGGEWINNSQKNVLKGMIKDKKISNKETFKEELKRIKRHDELLEIVDISSGLIIKTIGRNGLKTIKNKIVNDEITNKELIHKEIIKIKNQQDLIIKNMQKIKMKKKSEELKKQKEEMKKKELYEYLDELKIYGNSLKTSNLPHDYYKYERIFRLFYNRKINYPFDEAIDLMYKEIDKGNVRTKDEINRIIYVSMKKYERKVKPKETNYYSFSSDSDDDKYDSINGYRGGWER